MLLVFWMGIMWFAMIERKYLIFLTLYLFFREHNWYVIASLFFFMFWGPNCPRPSCPGPNCPRPNCPGPNLPRTVLGAQEWYVPEGSVVMQWIQSGVIIPFLSDPQRNDFFTLFFWEKNIKTSLCALYKKHWVMQFFVIFRSVRENFKVKVSLDHPVYALACQKLRILNILPFCF